jgi:hypothetical protein
MKKTDHVLWLVLHKDKKPVSKIKSLLVPYFDIILETNNHTLIPSENGK